MTPELQRQIVESLNRQPKEPRPEPEDRLKTAVRREVRKMLEKK